MLTAEKVVSVSYNLSFYSVVLGQGSDELVLGSKKLAKHGNVSSKTDDWKCSDAGGFGGGGLPDLSVFFHGRLIDCQGTIEVRHAPHATRRNGIDCSFGVAGNDKVGHFRPVAFHPSQDRVRV